ncbi:hypothetical protein A4S06_00370 [Erysipelotrichaceae bacterium MTC7]|nr:hypothetical protein A4S06_00370 [Erysipelotrichaceae bacterium MTC7]
MIILVLDMGGTNLKYALMNEKFDFLEKKAICSPIDSRKNFFETILNLYNQYKQQISGVAISLAGRVNTEIGYVHHGGSYQFIKEEFLQKEFEELFHCPVTIANDAECALLGEHRFGNLEGVQNAISIIIGTAIGGSILINGKIYKGSHCNSGEFSSIVIDPKNKDWSRYWFAHNSYQALTNKYAKLKNIDSSSVTGKIFFENIDEDSEKIKILNIFCKDMANAIYNLQCAFDVEKIIIGGGVSQQPILINTINEEVKKIFKKMEMFHVVCPEISPCKYANDSNLLGALLVHIDKYYR